ncbi:MAG: DUF4157 domain-containing protein [Nannocystaceae bacterium]
MTCLQGKVKASLDPPANPGGSRPRSGAAALAIAPPSAPAEREATEFADRVVRGLPLRGERLETRRGGLAREGAPGASAKERVGPSFAASLARSRGDGRPLPKPLAAEFTAALKAEPGALDQVRVHDDARAAELSAEIRARAFTSGQDVYFAKDAYAPTSARGRRLLAHELAHTQQQQRAALIHREPDPEPAPDAAARADELTPAERGAIIDGRYADLGQHSVTRRTRTVRSIKRTWAWRKGRFIDEEVEREEEVIEATFTQELLERARRYLDAAWAPLIDTKRAHRGGGDTKAKRVALPDWVYAYQDKLAAQKPKDYVPRYFERDINPNWGDDSLLAQRLIEAFLRAWHAADQGTAVAAIPANLEELYRRTGVSEKAGGNAQATLLGDPNVYGWCGPATYNAVVLGLFRRRLRFKTGTPPITPAMVEGKSKKEAAFIRSEVKRRNKGLDEAGVTALYQAEMAKIALMREITAQAAYLIHRDPGDGKNRGFLRGDRALAGDQAYTAPLEPGDLITQAVMNGSPVSGHVLTVIREIRDPGFDGSPGATISTIYGISGNAGQIGGGSVRIEQFTREMPPPTLSGDLGPMSSIGNRTTLARSVRARAEQAELARLAKEQGVSPTKVDKAAVRAGADAREAGRRAALVAELRAAEATFAAKSGMTYADFLAASRKPQTTRVYTIRERYKHLILNIGRIKGQIGVIDDHGRVARLGQQAGVPIAPDDARYGQEYASGVGRFRPSAIGHMWVTTIIKASRHADANTIRAELDLDPQARERRLIELGLDKGMSTADYQQLVLDMYSVEPLPGDVHSLWPGAIAALEGEGRARDYEREAPDEAPREDAESQ